MTPEEMQAEITRLQNEVSTCEVMLRHAMQTINDLTRQLVLAKASGEAEALIAVSKGQQYAWVGQDD